MVTFILRSLSSRRGWLSSPVPPSASGGGCAIVRVAVARGVVVFEPFPTTGGGVDGGGDEVGAAAATTSQIEAITNILPIIPTIPFPPIILPSDANQPPIVRANIAHTLLPMAMIVIASHTISSGGRGRPSGGPRGARHFVDHSLPPPTVVVDRAAWHGSDRPSVFANTTLVAVPPRPGPASLLSSSMRPQPGRIAQRGGRAGSALRAAGTTGRGNASADDGLLSAGALVATHAAIQVSRGKIFARGPLPLRTIDLAAATATGSASNAASTSVGKQGHSDEKPASRGEGTPNDSASVHVHASDIHPRIVRALPALASSDRQRGRTTASYFDILNPACLLRQGSARPIA